MRHKSLALAITLALNSPPLVLADTVEERLNRMEAEMAELKRQMGIQETTIQQQADTIAEQRVQLQGTPRPVQEVEETIEERLATESEGDAWYDKVAVGAVVEVEAAYSSPYEGDDESDIVLSTFELGIGSQVTDWVEVVASLLYEEDDTDLEVDVAFITLANADISPAFLTAGQIYVPFETYETNLVSDPLTLEMGETRETALQAGFARDDFNGSVYVFNGDNEKDGKSEIRSWGATLGFARELENGSVAASVGYLSDVGDSDTLQDVINDNQGDNDTDLTAAWTLSAVGRFGPFTLIGEYLAATESFSATAVPWKENGAKPSAWNLEAGYDFSLFSKASTVAVAYQGTDEAMALELPERRFLLGLSTEILDNTSLSLEWAHDEDYKTSEGGTGKSADSVVAQLAVEF